MNYRVESGSTGAWARRLSSRDKPFDTSVLSGIGLSFALIMLGMISSGLGAQVFHLGSFLLVLGGTIGAALVHFSYADLAKGWSALKETFYAHEYNPDDRIAYLVALSGRVRRDGLLVLDNETLGGTDRFLRMGIQITVDGQQSADLKRILETEMRASFDRQRRAALVFQTMGSYAPAMGLIGTLLGLVQMLSQLENPSTIGPAMALALITTLYGALFANVIFLPIAGKIRNRSEEEALVKAITIEGLISLSKQENPIMLEQRLQSFLPTVAHG